MPENNIELTPKEATSVVEYILKHPNEYIELHEALGTGYGYTLTISSDKDTVKKEITDFDSF